MRGSELHDLELDAELETGFAALALLEGDLVFDGPEVAEVLAQTVDLLVELRLNGVVAPESGEREALVDAVGGVEGVLFELVAEELGAEAGGPELGVGEGDAGVELLKAEAVGIEALEGVEANPLCGHEGDVGVEIGGALAGCGGAAAEVAVLREGEDDQVADAALGVAGLEALLDAEAQGVDLVEIVEVADVGQVDGGQAGGEDGAVDVGDELAALLGVGDEAILDEGLDDVAESVDAPGLALGVELAEGAGAEVAAELGEDAGVRVLVAEGGEVVGNAGAGDGGGGEPRGEDGGAFEAVVGVEAFAGELGGDGGGVLAQGDEAGGGALDDAAADGGGEAVEAELGDAALGDLAFVGLEAGEGGGDVVVAGVVDLEERLRLLVMREALAGEVADGLGVALVGELAHDGEVVAVGLEVAPVDVAAFAADLVVEAEDVLAEAAVGFASEIVNPAGAEVAEESGVAALGVVLGGGAEDEAAFAVEADLGAEEDAVGDGGEGGDVEEGAEGSAIAGADLGVDRGNVEALAEDGEREQRDGADAQVRTVGA